MRFQNTVALVTGAYSGIGAATAMLFAREGAKVVAADIKEPTDTVQAIKDCGGQAIALQGDLSNSEAVNRIVATAVETFGQLDILINNAGIGGVAPSIEDVSEEDWDRLFAINVKSGFLCTKAALPHLRRATNASILFTASIAGLEGNMGLTPYATTKAAVINMARSLALDHAKDGIRVNVVCPGATDTPMLRAVPIPMEVFASGLPLGKVVTPEEIAEGFAYLASPVARSVTGHVLVIDAGYTAGDFRLTGAN